MIEIKDFIAGFARTFPDWILRSPWNITKDIESAILYKIQSCDSNYHIRGKIAIHKSARIEEGVVVKEPIFIGENCFVAAHAYLRGGVYLDKSVAIGPGCEIKSSLIFEKSALAHFNFIGDSIVGSNVNFEAGSIIANHHNDRDDKEIYITLGGERIATGSRKFGALVGDSSKIGANAVLSPGTILQRGSVVGRLQLVSQ